MPAQTILFLGDKLHKSQSAASIYSVSSTANGFNSEMVRDTAWTGAWKPSDGTSDEYIQIDGGSAGWLGSVGETAYIAIAYDARGADQTTILVYQDVADSPVGAFVTSRATFTLDTTAPCVDYVSFPVSTGGRQYYRLTQLNAARGGGTKTVPIYAAACFSATEAYVIDTDYPGHEVGPGGMDSVSQVGIMDTAGGLTYANANGRTFQEFDLTFTSANVTLWSALRDALAAQDGPSRCFWAQYAGLRNPAKADFQMVRQVGMRWSASREYPDEYDTIIRVRSEPGPR